MKRAAEIVAVLVAVGGCAALASDVPALRADTLPPHKTSARVALDPTIQAKARRMVVVRADLPSGWFAAKGLPPQLDEHQGPGLKCGGHTADLSSLVQRGGWGSKFAFDTAQQVARAEVATATRDQRARPERSDGLYNA